MRTTIPMESSNFVAVFRKPTKKPDKSIRCKQIVRAFKKKAIKEKKQKKITKKISPVHSRRLLTTVHRTVDYPSGGRSD